MSKRHTLGISKWLPSTKDKITFKITLRPSTPDISKHFLYLCICDTAQIYTKQCICHKGTSFFPLLSERKSRWALWTWVDHRVLTKEPHPPIRKLAPINSALCVSSCHNSTTKSVGFFPRHIFHLVQDDRIIGKTFWFMCFLLRNTG